MPQSFEDVKYQALGAMGYMGTLNEREYAFFSAIAAGGPIPGTVSTSGAQTIGGVKTFSSSPIVPTPTTATQAANKSYVDGRLSAAQRTAIDGLTGASTAADIVAALQAV